MYLNIRRLLMIFLIALCLVGCKGKDKEEIKYVNTDLYPKIQNHSNLVFTINESMMTSVETEMVVSLQGIVAKTNASIYIINSQEIVLWEHY